MSAAVTPAAATVHPIVPDNGNGAGGEPYRDPGGLTPGPSPAQVAGWIHGDRGGHPSGCQCRKCNGNDGVGGMRRRAREIVLYGCPFAIVSERHVTVCGECHVCQIEDALTKGRV